VRLIRVQENQEMPEEDFLRELQVALPHEKTRPLFRTLLSWGRYAEIISYDQRHHLVRLYTGRRVHKSSAPNGNSNPPMPPDDSAPPALPTETNPPPQPIIPAEPPAQ